MKAKEKNLLLYLPLSHWICIGIYLLLAFIFCNYYHGFVEGRVSAIGWLASSWNPQTDYEHGWLIPLLCIYMLIHALKGSPVQQVKGSMHGLWSIILGAFLCVVAARTQQPRIAVAAIPFLLIGPVWYYWGWCTMLKTAFPFFFLWMSIPLPGFQHATVGMQILSAEAAHWIAGVCGIDTIIHGTSIASANGDWDSFNIAGGCSGMRSLMALFMISIAWAYLADKLSLWKRIVLGLSAIPLSIIGNAFRVSSIFICAEYINPAFAGKTWHDWSGLLFFFPASLLGLVILHSILAGEIPFLKNRKIVTRRNIAQSATTEKGDAA